MRNKLIELLKEPIPVLKGYASTGRGRMSIVDAQKYADRLLASGVIVPSVKLGQTVYSIVGGIIQVFEGEVYEITYGRFGFTYRSTRKGYFTLAFNDEHIGKTVFLTKEGARKALAERGGK